MLRIFRNNVLKGQGVVNVEQLRLQQIVVSYGSYMVSNTMLTPNMPSTLATPS